MSNWVYSMGTVEVHRTTRRRLDEEGETEAKAKRGRSGYRQRELATYSRTAAKILGRSTLVFYWLQAYLYLFLYIPPSLDDVEVGKPYVYGYSDFDYVVRFRVPHREISRYINDSFTPNSFTPNLCLNERKLTGTLQIVTKACIPQLNQFKSSAHKTHSQYIHHVHWAC